MAFNELIAAISETNKLTFYSCITGSRLLRFAVDSILIATIVFFVTVDFFSGERGMFPKSFVYLQPNSV